MKGLIIKDLLNLRKQAKLIGIFVILYAVMGYTMQDTSFVSAALIIITTIMSITTFAYDDLAKWNKYALSMPITRKEMVMSKYILSFILEFIGTIAAIFVSAGITLIKGKQLFSSEFIQEFIPPLLISIGIGALFISILIPLIYKFGTEKARIGIIVTVLVPTVFGMLAPTIFPNGLTISQNVMNIIPFALITTVVIIAIFSYFISVGIFNKNEV